MKKKKISKKEKKLEYKKQEKQKGITLIALLIGLIVVVLVVFLIVFGILVKEEISLDSGEDDEQKVIEGTTIKELAKQGILEIGDFIDYDAGSWTLEEIEEIDTNGKDILPTTVYQFGGYTVGDSRNDSATAYSDEYDYVKFSDGSDISGWRIFDIDDDTGMVTLISSANVEAFYNPYTSGDTAYISEYILTGDTNGNIEDENYEIREWSMYENNYAITGSAKVITYDELCNWYEKYLNITNLEISYTSANFQTLYLEYEPYQTLIDNYSYYWLATASTSNRIYYVNPDERVCTTSNGGTYGVRILVTLASNTELYLDEENEKTILNSRSSVYGDSSWTHNMWNIIK